MDELAAVQQQLAELKSAFDIEKSSVEKLKRSLNEQEILASVLHVCQQPIDLQEIFDQTLRFVLTNQRFTTEPRGCIFMVSDNPSELEMQAQYGLPDEIKKSCAIVPLGYCLCGSAAKSGELAYCDQVDHRHENITAATPPHGHYCVPIRGDDKVIGVLNLYLPDGHPWSVEENNFLNMVADTMAGAILRTQTVDALMESEQHTRDLLNSTAEAIYGLDLEGRCTFANAACAKLLGYKSTDEMLGQNMHELAHSKRPDGASYPIDECPIYSSFATGNGTHVDTEVLWRADGSSFPAEYWSYPILRSEKVIGAVVTFLDITKRKQAQKLLLESEAKFRSTFQATFVGMIVVVDNMEIISEWNSGAEKIFGYSESEAVGQSLTMLMPERLREAHLKGFSHAAKQGALTHAGVTHELTGLRKNGEEFPLELTLGSWTQDGNSNFCAIILDTTERKEAEEKLKHLASHDPLTGVYNRLVLEQRLSDEIHRANRYNHSLSVFMLDLDHFKQVNDTYGHHIGDAVLQNFAKTLQSSIRNTDYPARYGGEEFIILLPETPFHKAKELAERLCKKIAANKAKLEDGSEMSITASIGIATFPEHAKTGDELIGRADAAMYRAKKAGRNQVKTPE